MQTASLFWVNYTLSSSERTVSLSVTDELLPDVKGNQEAEGPEGQSIGQASRRHNQKRRKPLSGSQKKPRNRFSPHPRRWESQRCHPSSSEFTDWLVKAGTWETFAGPSLDLSRNKKLHLLSLRLRMKTRTGGSTYLLKANSCSNLAENMLELPLTPSQLERVSFFQDLGPPKFPPSLR